jgi:hypothetical protein
MEKAWWITQVSQERQVRAAVMALTSFTDGYIQEKTGGQHGRGSLGPF